MVDAGVALAGDDPRAEHVALFDRAAAHPLDHVVEHVLVRADLDDLLLAGGVDDRFVAELALVVVVDQRQERVEDAALRRPEDGLELAVAGELEQREHLGAALVDVLVLLVLGVGEHKALAERLAAGVLVGVAELERVVLHAGHDRAPAAAGDLVEADLEAERLAPPEEEDPVGALGRERRRVGGRELFVVAHEGGVEAERQRALAGREIVALEDALEEVQHARQHGADPLVLLGDAAVDLRDLAADAREGGGGLLGVALAGGIEARFEGVAHLAEDRRIARHEAADVRRVVGVAVDEGELRVDELRRRAHQIDGGEAEAVTEAEFLFEVVRVGTPRQLVELSFQLGERRRRARAALDRGHVEGVDAHRLVVEVGTVLFGVGELAQVRALDAEAQGLQDADGAPEEPLLAGDARHREGDLEALFPRLDPHDRGVGAFDAEHHFETRGDALGVEVGDFAPVDPRRRRVEADRDAPVELAVRGLELFDGELRSGLLPGAALGDLLDDEHLAVGERFGFVDDEPQDAPAGHELADRQRIEFVALDVGHQQRVGTLQLLQTGLALDVEQQRQQILKFVRGNALEEVGRHHPFQRLVAGLEFRGLGTQQTVDGNLAHKQLPCLDLPAGGPAEKLKFPGHHFYIIINNGTLSNSRPNFFRQKYKKSQYETQSHQNGDRRPPL